MTGGTINLLIQITGSRIAQRERLAVKRQEDLATAFSAMVKIIKIFSAISNIRSDIKASLSNLNTKQIEVSDFWQVLLPFATIPPFQEFTNGESAFILSTKDRNLMLAAIELADVHNDFLKLVTVYSERREALTNSFDVEKMQGSHGSSHFDEEQMKKLTPRIIQLRTLTTAIISRSESDYDQAQRVFDRFKICCSRRFGSDFPPLEVDPQKPDPSISS